MKIFLSSTYRDLIAERQAVEQVIVALGQHFKGMEHFFAREETPLEMCLAEVARSHWLVLVVGQRYGATDARGISYTEREYLRASSRFISAYSSRCWQNSSILRRRGMCARW